MNDKERIKQLEAELADEKANNEALKKLLRRAEPFMRNYMPAVYYQAFKNGLSVKDMAGGISADPD